MNEYFTGKNSWIYYTNDNWKTFFKERSTISGYSETNNSDIKYKVILRDHLGEARAKIIIKELDNIRELLKQIDHGHEQNGYGHEFEVFAISTIYHISYQSCIENNIILGSEDGKIDAIVVEDKNVSIYQIKLTAFDANDILVMKDNYEKFMRGEQDSLFNASDLESFLNEHKSILQNKNPKYVIIANTRTANFKPDDIYNMFFVNSLLPLDKNHLSLHLEIPERNITENCIHSTQITRDYNYANDGNTYVFIMSALDLVNAILNIPGVDQDEDNLNKLFYDNVRGFLGVNKDIVHTLENEPENFLNYSNGITITGDVTFGSYFLNIDNPMISNGQQTLYTLILNKEKLTQVKVLVMIKGENDQQVKMNIARNTNNQKQVKAIDLLSLNNGLRKIQRKLLDTALKQKDNSIVDKFSEGYYLDIYQNGVKGYENLVKDLFPNDRIISLRDFIRLYMAVTTNKIGDWKRNLNDGIETLTQDTNLVFNYSVAIKVCDVLRCFKNNMKYILEKDLKNNLNSSDLTLQYILYTNDYSFKEALMIVYYINEKNENKYSKIIDLHKSNNVLEEIRSAINLESFESIEFPDMIINFDIIKNNQSEYLNFIIKNHNLKDTSANTYVLAILQINSLILDQNFQKVNLFSGKETLLLFDYESVIASSPIPEPSKRKLLNAYLYLKKYYEFDSEVILSRG